jgi:hypothetical protein
MVLLASVLYSTSVASHTASFSNSFEQGVIVYSRLTKGSHTCATTILSTSSNLSSPTGGQGAL